MKAQDTHQKRLQGLSKENSVVYVMSCSGPLCCESAVSLGSWSERALLLGFLPSIQSTYLSVDTYSGREITRLLARGGVSTPSLVRPTTVAKMSVVRTICFFNIFISFFLDGTRLHSICRLYYTTRENYL